MVQSNKQWCSIQLDVIISVNGIVQSSQSGIDISINNQ